jgi:hypothetical protein
MMLAGTASLMAGCTDPCSAFLAQHTVIACLFACQLFLRALQQMDYWLPFAHCMQLL